MTTTVGLASGLVVNSPLIVAKVTPSQTGTVNGGILLITLTMSEAMTVDTSDGAPSLSLSNGATASYDADASNPPGKTLAFDYAIGLNDQTANLGIAAVNLNGASINDAKFCAADFTHALAANMGVAISPELTRRNEMAKPSDSYRFMALSSNKKKPSLSAFHFASDCII